MSRFYVFTGTARQAQDLANLLNFAPGEWRYVLGPETIMGTRKQPMILSGTWEDRPDARQVVETAVTRDMTLLYKF